MAKSDHKIAEGLYDRELLPLNLFEEAYVLFPEYNRAQADDAADWILGRFYDLAEPNTRDLLDRNEDVRSLLYEAVIDGLT